MSSTIHDQRVVQINVAVDVGISDLIAALSKFPKLQTIESCEGDDKRGAWVCFCYGLWWDDPWRELAEFTLGFLGPSLLQAAGDSAHVSIHVLPSGCIHGEITIRPGAVEAVTGAILQMVNQPDQRGRP